MPPAETPPLTLLLHAWKRGDADAFSQVITAVHGEFLRMAANRLHGHDLSLSKGDVVNEAVIRLLQSQQNWANRAHFFATVSLHMRSVLREHARAKLTDKRGGDRIRMTLTSAALGEESMAADVLVLDQLLDRLAASDPRGAEVLQLTYFAGLQRADIAEVLGISLATVDRELRFARAWLSEQLGRDLEA